MSKAITIDPEVAPVVQAVLTNILDDMKFNGDLMQKLQYDMGHTDGYRKGYRAGVEAAQAQMRLAQKATEYAMGITDPPEE